MIRLPAGWFVSDAEAATLATVRPHEAAWWRRNGAVTPAPLDRLLAQFEAGGAGGAPSSAPCSADLPVLVSAPTAVRRWERPTVTVREAAGRLKISERAVRGLCERRTLDAVRDDAGRWRIFEDSVRSHRPRRRVGQRTDAAGDDSAAA